MAQNIKVKVVKIAGNKTVMGEASYMKQHPVYKKYVKVSRKYMIHDEDNSVKVGDEIFIKSSRPISKRKVWVIVNKGEV
jgi:small subunit ribosomal protein S17